MIKDSIVEEVRRNRRATEEACGNDWKRLLEHYRRVQQQAGRVIRGQARRPNQVTPKK